MIMVLPSSDSFLVGVVGSAILFLHYQWGQDQTVTFLMMSIQDIMGFFPLYFMTSVAIVYKIELLRTKLVRKWL